MQIIELPITELTPDPANVRVHSPRNIEAIAGSLRRFGQQRPIVIDSKNVVRAGSGTLTAAISLGWSSIKVVRSDLSDVELVAFGVADNRVGSEAVGSTFDDDALASVLAALKAEDEALLTDVGYTADEFDRLIGEMSGSGVPNDPDTQWVGMPTCESEDLTAAASIKINFASIEDREAFAKLIGQTITDNTRSLWYPAAAIGRIADKRYSEVPQ